MYDIYGACYSSPKTKSSGLAGRINWIHFAARITNKVKSECMRALKIFFYYRHPILRLTMQKSAKEEL